jgi:hypothetical protein
MIVPDNFERAKILFDRLKVLNVECTPKFTRRDISELEYFQYTDEQRSWIQSNYFNNMRPFGIDWDIPRNLYFDGVKIKFMEVLDKRMHRFKGYTCKAGLNRLMVDVNGNMIRCTKRVGGIIGNIYKRDYVLPTDPITCTVDSCPCKLDAIINKWS